MAFTPVQLTGQRRSGPFSEYDIEDERIRRRQIMAQALMQQSQSPIESPMAGGFVVRASPLQGLAKLAQAYVGSRMMNRGDEEARGLADQRTTALIDTINQAVQAGKGTPAQPAIEAPPDELGGGPGRPAIPAGPADNALVASILMQNPQTRQAGIGLFGKSLEADPLMTLTPGQVVVRKKDPTVPLFTAPQAPKGQRVEIPDGKGGKRVGFVDMNHPDPMSTFREAGAEPPKAEVLPSGQTYNPFTVAPGTMFNDPNRPINIGPDGRPIVNQTYIDAKSAIARAGAPNVSTTVNTRQETEEAKTVGKGFGEAYNDIQKAGVSAQDTINRYGRMEQLLEGVTTGKLTPAGTEIAAWMESAGIKVDPKLGNKQAARALANEIALMLRNPSGGAGMPGALSDKDREFLVSMTPGLANTPEGNRILIETAKKLAKRNIDIARLAREYRNKNRTMDEGFYSELVDFAEKNPLFGTAKPGASGAGAGSSGPSSGSSGRGRVIVDF